MYRRHLLWIFLGYCGIDFTDGGVYSIYHQTTCFHKINTLHTDRHLQAFLYFFSTHLPGKVGFKYLINPLTISYNFESVTYMGGSESRLCCQYLGTRLVVTAS